MQITISYETPTTLIDERITNGNSNDARATKPKIKSKNKNEQNEDSTIQKKQIKSGKFRYFPSDSTYRIESVCRSGSVMNISYGLIVS